MSKVGVAFLEVGHGDSIIITYPDEVTASIIDTPNAKITFDFIMDQGIKYVDWIIISHADIDHFKGISGLITNLSNFGIGIGNLGYIRGDKKLRTDKEYSNLRKQFVWYEDHLLINITEPYAQKYATLVNINDMIINCIFPWTPADVENAGDKANDCSIVLILEYRDHKVLLSGDLEGRGWYRLINKCQERSICLKSNVFKLPHHGSWFLAKNDAVSLQDVIALIDAELAIMSVGYNEKFLFPAPQTIASLKKKTCRIMCTGSGKSCHDGTPLINMPSWLNLGISCKKPSIPCAGTILLELTESDIAVSPTEKEHLEIIRNLKTPMCL